VEQVEVSYSRILTETGCLKACFPNCWVGPILPPHCLLQYSRTIARHELNNESVDLFSLFCCPSKEAELITKFLPMLMSFVVDDHTFNVDQKLPAEEKGPVPYPSTIPEAFTKYVICCTDLYIQSCYQSTTSRSQPTLIGKNNVCDKMKAFLE